MLDFGVAREPTLASLRREGGFFITRLKDGANPIVQPGAQLRDVLARTRGDVLDVRVAATYARRWAIELIFKELKNQYWLHHTPSSRKHIVEALILTAVLTLIVSRRLLAAVAKRMSAAIECRLRPRSVATIARHSRTLA